jgi:hypothetical protein
MRQSRSLGFVASALLALMLAIIVAAANDSGEHPLARREERAQRDPMPYGPLYVTPATASDEEAISKRRGDRNRKEKSSPRPTTVATTPTRMIVQQPVAPKRDVVCCRCVCGARSVSLTDAPGLDGAQRPTGGDNGRSRECCDPTPAAAPAQDGKGGAPVPRAAAPVETTEPKTTVSARSSLAVGLGPTRVGVHVEPAHLLPELVR